MELSTILPKSKRVEIYHPGTKKGLGLVFYMKAPHCEEVQNVVRRQRNELIESKGVISEAKSNENGIELISAVIENWEWEGDATWNGEKPDFNVDNLIAVLKSKAGEAFILKQLLAEYKDADSFFMS